MILDSSEKKGPTSHEVHPLSPLMPADSFNQLETYLWDQDKKSKHHKPHSIQSALGASILAMMLALVSSATLRSLDACESMMSQPRTRVPHDDNFSIDILNQNLW